jgi:hypothetical protein
MLSVQIQNTRVDSQKPTDCEMDCRRINYIHERRSQEADSLWGVKQFSVYYVI